MDELDKIISKLTEDKDVKKKFDFGRFLFAINQSEKRIEINKEWTLGNIEITFNWRSPKNIMGRFGGGWQWSLGFVASKSTIIFNILVFSVRFSKKRAPIAKQEPK